MLRLLPNFTNSYNLFLNSDKRNVYPISINYFNYNEVATDISSFRKVYIISPIIKWLKFVQDDY